MSVNRKVTVPLGRSSIASALHGKARSERVTALRPRPCFELAAVDRHALAHADETVPASAAVTAARAVVGDDDLHLPSP